MSISMPAGSWAVTSPVRPFMTPVFRTVSLKAAACPAVIGSVCSLMAVKRTAPTSGRRALKAAVWRVGGSATEIMSARYGTAARLIAAASRNLPWRRAELGKPSFSTWILPVLISSERASGDATSLPVRWTALPSQRPVPNSKAPGSTQVRLPWLPGF